MNAPPVNTLSEVRAGVAAILPAVIAMLPFGLILGQQAASQGLTPLEVLAMSSIVFAGSAQMLAISLWTEPVPVAALTLSALLVNLRHVLMGASIASKMAPIGRWRAPAAFLLTDEHWAVAERRALGGPLTLAFWLGSSLFLFLAWQAVTVLGAVFGSFIRDPERYGFDFAFPAMFIALALGFWNGWRTAPVMAASGLVATAVHATVPGAWYIIAGAFAGIAAAVAIDTGARPQGQKAQA